MTDVARFAASVAAVPSRTMTSTLSRTNSATISGSRSRRPSDQRYSIAIVRPSIQPSSFNRCTKSAINWSLADRVLARKKPMVGLLAVCCARAASGQATAAPPKTVMNSRRLRSSILPRCHRHHTPATGGLGLVGLPHLQLADEGLNRLWARPEFTVLRPRTTDQPHSAAGCMALEGMVGLRCNQESGDVDNPASSDDCHIHWKSTNADWPASSDRRKSNDTVLMRMPLTAQADPSSPGRIVPRRHDRAHSIQEPQPA